MELYRNIEKVYKAVVNNAYLKMLTLEEFLILSGSMKLKLYRRKNSITIGYDLDNYISIFCSSTNIFNAEEVISTNRKKNDMSKIKFHISNGAFAILDVGETVEVCKNYRQIQYFLDEFYKQGIKLVCAHYLYFPNHNFDIEYSIGYEWEKTIQYNNKQLQILRAETYEKKRLIVEDIPVFSRDISIRNKQIYFYENVKKIVASDNLINEKIMKLL